MTPIGSVFCDWLSVTVPKGSGVLVMDSLRPLVACMGASVVSEGLWCVDGGGTLKTGCRGSVDTFGFSGSFLEVARHKGCFEGLLWAFHDVEHRVTRMDAALDFEMRLPAQYISRLYERGASGGLRLTRKALGPESVAKVVGPALYSDGPVGGTGSVYLGKRTAEVHARVYDKRQERIAKTGVDPGSNRVRFELTVTGKVGATLRDVANPTSLFWCFMSRTLLPRPEGVPDWFPCAEGYDLPPKPEVLPMTALTQKLQSPEVRELVKLANDCGPYGMQILKRELDALAAADSEARSQVLGNGELLDRAKHGAAVTVSSTNVQ